MISEYQGVMSHIDHMLATLKHWLHNDQWVPRGYESYWSYARSGTMLKSSINSYLKRNFCVWEPTTLEYLPVKFDYNTAYISNSIVLKIVVQVLVQWLYQADSLPSLHSLDLVWCTCRSDCLCSDREPSQWSWLLALEPQYWEALHTTRGLLSSDLSWVCH